MGSHYSPYQRAKAFSKLVQKPLLKLSSDQNVGRAAGLSKKQASTKFPTRMSRYLIPYAWLMQQREKLGRPLRICEIGVGSGQMKKFVDFLFSNTESSGALYEKWDGFDIALRREELLAAKYDHIEDFNADGEFPQQFPNYDVVLLLHVLEHLKNPEASVQRLVSTFTPGTLLIGGVPSAPEPLARKREICLRKKYLVGGHWCKFSANRVEKLLQTCKLQEPEVTGAFALRWSGFFLENHRWWLEKNLVFAHLLPWWPGEVYFQGSR